MSKQYQITANGEDMGTYTAETREEALEAYAKAAGYESFQKACEVSGQDAAGVLVEVAS